MLTFIYLFDKTTFAFGLFARYQKSGRNIWLLTKRGQFCSRLIKHLNFGLKTIFLPVVISSFLLSSSSLLEKSFLHSAGQKSLGGSGDERKKQCAKIWLHRIFAFFCAAWPHWIFRRTSLPNFVNNGRRKSSYAFGTSRNEINTKVTRVCPWQPTDRPKTRHEAKKAKLKQLARNSIKSAKDEEEQWQSPWEEIIQSNKGSSFVVKRRVGRLFNTNTWKPWKATSFLLFLSSTNLLKRKLYMVAN